MVPSPELLSKRILAEAHSLGFDLAGIVSSEAPPSARFYRSWLEQGYHGEMAYLARPDALTKREDLHRVLPGVRSVVMVGANHHIYPLAPGVGDDPARGVLASYAWGDDYHDLMLPRLRQLLAFVESEMGQVVAHRAYVDTGPVLERDLAARAGLGFMGKNTNLIHPRLGSWLLLGELLLGVDLPPEVFFRQGLQTDAGEGPGQRPRPTGKEGLCPPGVSVGTCGRCTRCLDACPTGALVAPYVLDARRCISYLTIELKGSIPPQLRPQIGNRIFGCDICQEVCPWNRRFAQATLEPGFQPRPEDVAPLLLDLITLDDEGFRQRFRGTPVLRAKRRGLLRNVAVALGNWRDPAAVPALARVLHDTEPLIREHAAWALARIGTPEAQQCLAQAAGAEKDAQAREGLAGS